jgi:peroxidase
MPTTGKGSGSIYAIPDPAPVPDQYHIPEYKADEEEPMQTNATSSYGDMPGEISVSENPCPLFTREFRTIDGSCNNERNIRWGATDRPMAANIIDQCVYPSGQDRPSPRVVSNIVCDQRPGENIPSKRNLNQLVVSFGQMLDHSIVATPGGDENMDIPVPAEDEFFYAFNSQNVSSMRFTRSKKAEVEDGTFSPLNSLSSYIDLAAVYGDRGERSIALRTLEGGRMKVSENNNLPLNTGGFANNPRTDDTFYLAGDFRANEQPGLLSMQTVWLREHNSLCDTLAKKYPGWGDERLYQMARKINGAAFQRVVYEEFIPTVTGRKLPEYVGYDKTVDVTISSTFSTAAYRIGHTLVGIEVPRYGSGNTKLPALEMRDTFFRSAQVLQSRSVEEFLRGMILTKAQEVDPKIVPLLRNYLFSDVWGSQESKSLAFDLVSLNIQRGRDNCIPPYQALRVAAGLKPVKTFAEITSNREFAWRLSKAYGGDVEKIDAWVGLLSEDHLDGGSLGPTAFGLWVTEFSKLRAGDRFFYQREGLFSRKVFGAIKSHGGMRMRDIILRNTDISPSELPANIWFGQQT